jgi:hypothetical protein
MTTDESDRTGEWDSIGGKSAPCSRSGSLVSSGQCGVAVGSSPRQPQRLALAPDRVDGLRTVGIWTVARTERLASVVEIMRCSYNFIRPHARLQLGRRPRTPSMLAGIFDRVLSWRSVFAWPVPPPKPAAVLALADPTPRLTTWPPRRRRAWQRGDSDDSAAGLRRYCDPTAVRYLDTC